MATHRFFLPGQSAGMNRLLTMAASACNPGDRLFAQLRASPAFAVAAIPGRLSCRSETGIRARILFSRSE
jgi:hypothetical protein